MVTLTGVNTGDPQISLGATLSAQVDIADNDAATVTIAATDASAAEPADDGRFTVTLSQASATDTVIDYSITGTAANGTDFALLSGQVTILAGATTAFIDVDVTDDPTVEGLESVVVTLTGVNTGDPQISLGATLSAQVDIADNDAATVTIAATDASAAEPADDGRFTVTLSQASATDTVIDYSITGTAANGTDFALLSGQVTILAGASSPLSSTSTSPTTRPSRASESVVVTLTGIITGDPQISLGATLSAQVDIADNDAATVTIAATDASAAEPADDGRFTVTLSQASATDTVIDYSITGTAANGTDFALLSAAR